MFDVHDGVALERLAETDTHVLVRTALRKDGTLDGERSTLSLCGPRQRTMRTSPQFTQLMLVHVAPGAMRALFGVPARVLRDGALVPLEDVARARSAELLERLAMATTTERRLDVIAEMLARRCVRTGARPAFVRRAMDLLVRPGAVRVRRLANELGLSSRALEKRFDEAVGLSPMQFARIVRARAALAMIAEKEHASLAHVASSCGYHDQAHMTHELVRTFGRTPGTLARCFAATADAESRQRVVTVARDGFFVLRPAKRHT